MLTAVLLNYQRPYHLQRIVDSLRSHAFITEILCWNNGAPLALDGARVLGRGENVGTYGRFLAAAEASNEIIFTQDDDALVLNVPELYERFLTHRESIVAGLPNDASSRHYVVEAHKVPWINLGWGSVFLKDWIHNLNLWIDRYSEDALLKSKADRIFTVLHGKHDPIPAQIERLQHEGRESGRDAHAIYRQPGHTKMVREAVEKALTLREAQCANSG